VVVLSGSIMEAMMPGASSDGAHLRLLYPQWQGAGTSSVRELASEFPWSPAEPTA
jgi:hypothetical protein